MDAGATLLAFAPETPTEQRIQDAHDGLLTGDALLLEIADASLFIPSVEPVSADGSGFSPVLLEQEDALFVAVFTALSRAKREETSHVLQASIRQFLARMPAGYGMIVNPGYDAQILLPPFGVAALKLDLAPARSP